MLDKVDGNEFQKARRELCEFITILGEEEEVSKVNRYPGLNLHNRLDQNHYTDIICKSEHGRPY